MGNAVGPEKSMAELPALAFSPDLGFLSNVHYFGTGA